MYRIEKDVPVGHVSAMPNSRTYPLAKMVVGDSFLINSRRAESVSVLMAQFHKETKMRFTRRVKGSKCRVWRVK